MKKSAKVTKFTLNVKTEDRSYILEFVGDAIHYVRWQQRPGVPGERPDFKRVTVECPDDRLVAMAIKFQRAFKMALQTMREEAKDGETSADGVSDGGHREVRGLEEVDQGGAGDGGGSRAGVPERAAPRTVVRSSVRKPEGPDPVRGGRERTGSGNGGPPPGVSTPDWVTSLLSEDPATTWDEVDELKAETKPETPSHRLPPNFDD